MELGMHLKTQAERRKLSDMVRLRGPQTHRQLAAGAPNFVKAFQWRASRASRARTSKATFTVGGPLVRRRLAWTEPVLGSTCGVGRYLLGTTTPIIR